MKRKVLVQLVLPLLGLSVLFLLLAFEPLLAQRPVELLELSVILREIDSSASAVTRQGMERAALDLNAELRFLTLSTPNDAAEQRKLLEREMEGGADGVLLAPADRTELKESVRAAADHMAVVTLETDMSDEGAVACVSADNIALGKALGRAALNGVSEGDTILLVDSLPGDTGVTQRLESAAQVLEEAGIRIRVCRAEKWADLPGAMQKALETEQPALVMAFESAALERAAQAVQAFKEPPLLYGMGSTNAIAAGLEQGWITSIAAQNEFAAGYLAVAAAVSSIRQEPAQAAKPLAFSILRRENMYDPDNQKLLLPMVR